MNIRFPETAGITEKKQVALDYWQFMIQNRKKPRLAAVKVKDVEIDSEPTKLEESGPEEPAEASKTARSSKATSQKNKLKASQPAQVDALTPLKAVAEAVRIMKNPYELSI